VFTVVRYMKIVNTFLQVPKNLHMNWGPAKKIIVSKIRLHLKLVKIGTKDKL
jgi:hypothetical protein